LVAAFAFFRGFLPTAKQWLEHQAFGLLAAFWRLLHGGFPCRPVKAVQDAAGQRQNQAHKASFYAALAIKMRRFLRFFASLLHPQIRDAVPVPVIAFIDPLISISLESHP